MDYLISLNIWALSIDDDGGGGGKYIFLFLFAGSD